MHRFRSLTACIGLLIVASVLRGLASSPITPENVFDVVQVFDFEGHTGYVRDVAFSPDGTCLASIGDDRSVCLWDPATGEEIHRFGISSSGYINSLSFSPDGRLLASPHGVWDLESLSVVKIWTAEVMHSVFSPGGGMLAMGVVVEPVQLFDTTTWDVIRTFESLKHIAPTSDDSFGFEFSPDGAWLADGTLNEGIARIWDVETGTLARTLLVSSPGTDVHDVAFSADGRLLAAGGQGWNVLIFRAEDGGVEQSLATGEGTMSLDFSPDGRILAISCEGALGLWDVETGRRLRTLSHSAAVLPVTFSLDGRFLACGVHGGRVAVWTLRD